MRSPILTLKRAKALRRTLTAPERLLWVRLRLRLKGQPAWRRQHPVGSYVADFYCSDALLVAEIDGHLHGEEAQRTHDARRDAWMAAQGLQVQRIPASSVFADATSVADGLRLMALELSQCRG